MSFLVRIINLAFSISLICGFSAQAQQMAVKPPFDESVWRLDHLKNQKRVIRKYQEDRKYSYILFNPYNHRFSGSGLCNKFYGSYETQGEQLRITQFKATENTCISSEVNIQDQQFFGDLKKARYFSLENKSFILMDDNKNTLMAFQKNM